MVTNGVDTTFAPRREIIDYGDRGLLVRLSDPDEIGALCLAIVRRCDPAVVDVVATEHQVLVVHHLRSDRRALRDWLATIGSEVQASEESPLVEIDIDYDGEDLDAVAQNSGLTVNEVINAHRSGVYRAAFCGFAPGFAYLRGIDSRLQLPRRITPRPSVEPGSVGIAAGYCGIYPRKMPGGWHIIGHTTAQLWDLGRSRPALIEPGTTVQFRHSD